MFTIFLKLCKNVYKKFYEPVSGDTACPVVMEVLLVILPVIPMEAT